MVVTPRDALRLNAEDRKIVRDLEKRIDIELLKGYSVSFFDESMQRRKIREAIVQKYTRVGWDVDYTNNDHDGEYLFFKEKEKE